MKRKDKGQMIAEYAVMFLVIIAAVILAGATIFKPALLKFFDSTANVMNQASDQIVQSYASS
jgi:Flp pilus assembly pilin Flp